ncbi:MAG TPA: BON domain-containing protein [Bryobacteraceae bacterium]|nr:BON domain-containing protein [Bryobacteraceae bacterium]
MNRTRVAISALLTAALFSAGCTKKTASDQSLVTAIQSKLYADDATRAAGIKVDAKNGVVTLSGDVPSSDVELEAMKVANATPGIASVNDQMKVNAAAAPANNPPPPGNNPPPSANTPAPSDTSAPAQTASAPPPPPAQEPTPAPVPAAAPITPAPAPKPVSYTVPAGSRLQVRMIDAIDSRNNTVGQTFRGTLDAPLTRGNRVIVPAGAPVTVLLTNASSAGRIRGNSELQVRVTSITAHGQAYDVASDVYDQAGKGKGKQTAIRSGIGAAAGALIGGLAGGGKGAAIGAGAGGGAGLGYQFFTHGSQVKIPSETVLTFKLSEPLTIRR